ncbi:MSHA biogenesis protein MshA [Aliidiomarina taiwanensis]|uniref:MSHA biogenesis protein MshA n=1 Tax=Aliidiomarina taiwanensis TaxID=946228 RepID=A0A432X7M0_9GAMM|nr:prepilin-type N-terminal cleavage/methylation domain-containing protein [Aliidiomarina taiwanensis]RUO42832.1 MSHA biogenesis protein MshA [Aliidiomarina taiwanensis]
MYKQKGFTLIELIIVIVILGILAVTAAPKFFDFSKDARISTLQGLKAQLQSTATIEYARTALKGEALYPKSRDAQGGTKRESIIDAAGVDGSEWFIETVLDESVTFSVRKSSSSKRDNCYVKYNMDAARKDPPTFEVVTSGC